MRVSGQQLPFGLDDRLQLRRATADDIERLIDLHVETFSDVHGPLDRAVAEEHLKDLLERPHPSFSGDEMTVVEDVASGRLVSSQHLSHHVWSYGGVELGVGEIEHVSTRPEYRRQGLVREQTDVMHAWSLAAGELVTAINGIPWYYTQFGYELPLPKYNGRRLFVDYTSSIADRDAPFTVRDASSQDLDFIATTFAEASSRLLVSTVRSRAAWHYELEARHRLSPWYRRLVVLEDEGHPVGFASIVPAMAGVDTFEVAAGTPWSIATMSLARWLTSDPSTSTTSEGLRRSSWSFSWLGEDHPAFRSCPHLFGHPETLGSPFRRAAWYIRVPDLPALVAAVAPALECHLAGSDEAGYSGTILIGRYRDPGVALHFDRGAIVADVWHQTDLHDGDARMADGALLHLIFGSVTLAELEARLPYRVGVSPRARAVLNAVFPKRPSLLLPLY